MLLANQKEKEKLDTNYEEFWMDSDKFWICNPCLFQSKSIRVPKHLSKLRRGKFGYVGKSGKKSDIIDSKKTHENSVSLHKWCVQEYQKEIENKTETDRRNDLAGKKIVRNALFCFQESLGSKAFVRLNMKDFLAEEDLGLKLYNIATKNDSKKQFFWLRNVVFDVFTKHVKMFFDEHVKYFSVTLDKGQLNSEGICEVIISLPRCQPKI